MKAKIIIEGEKVQDIGYRYYLTEFALSSGIERFRAIDTEDGRYVIAFVDGDSEVVNEYCQLIKSSYPQRAIVNRVKVEDYIGYVPKIESFALIFNMGQSGKFIESAHRAEDSIRDESQKTRDELGGIIKDESQKTRDELGSKVDLLRADMRDFMSLNTKKIYLSGDC
ncbi:MAG: acylphosphatase [Archaeoglobaceae archaeon]